MVIKYPGSITTCNSLFTKYDFLQMCALLETLQKARFCFSNLNIFQMWYPRPLLRKGPPTPVPRMAYTPIIADAQT